MRRLTDLFKRFRRDESGAFIVIFGLLAIVLIATSGAVVDFTYTQTARSRAQTALDAAALAMQTIVNDVNKGSITQTDAEAQVKTKAQQMLQERLNDPSITATLKTATVNATQGKLTLTASVTVPTAFIQLVGIRTITAQLSSEATRGSSDIEVSVALDTTGSMAPKDKWGNVDYTKINALKGATNNLIDLVVQTSQTPTYSKIALVPYSYGVNVDTYATSVRGALATVTGAITTAAWASSLKTISSVSVVNNGAITITSTAHGLSTNDVVYIDNMTASGSGKKNVTNLNGSYYTITKVDANNFTLNSIKGGGTKTGTGGNLGKCIYSNCDVRLSGTFGSIHNGDGVYVSGISTLTNPNGIGYFATLVDTSTIRLPNTMAAGGQFVNGTGGTVTRANYKDVYYHFNTAAGDENTFASSTCVTERTGTDAFTDTAPSTAPLSPLYPSSAANCVSESIVPLTSDKTKLHATATALTAAGSTSGHIGLAWAWYMLAPKFSYLWPTTPIDSRPAAYKRNNLIKAVILMTDGQFNSQYCNGVTSQDTSPGSSNAINCDAPNGTSQAQAEALCTAIKNVNNGVLLYTVGFDIASASTEDVNARAFLSGCATDPSYFYQADTADDLNDAFEEIAQKLNALRISH